MRRAKCARLIALRIVATQQTCRIGSGSAAIPSAVSPTGTPVAYATNYAYDALNRPTGVSWNPVNTAAVPGAASSVVFAHSYNKANQRIGQSVSDNAWINYPAAAASTVSYTANALNQYTAVGAVTPTYDTNGNLTSDGTYTYGYDAENRLVSASGAGTSAAYTFDAQGNRKTVTTGGATTVFVTDADDREVLEYDGASGAIQRWYAYGLGPNDVLGQMNVPANTRTTFVPDLLGSVVATMASSTGTLSRFGYRPYGASTAPATPFGFTGQRLDVEAGGIYYFRARAYSPRLGRFLQPDPIGYDGGLNLYAYVGNDPLNLIDPEGLSALNAIQSALNSGLSLGQNLLQSSLDALVPDAHYSGLAQQEFNAGNYGYAAGYGIASLADALLGVASGGMSTRASTAVRGLGNEITSLYRAFTPRLANSAKAEAVIAETLVGKGNITSATKLSADELLEAGIQFLGPGYKEIGKPGSGVFRSLDNTRQFRIDRGSLTGSHAPSVPHGHLEIYAPGAKMPTVNNHIPFFD